MLYQKDFKAIAKELHDERVNRNMIADKRYKQGANDTIDILSGWFADYLATKNPKFDREKFLAACK